MTAKAREDLDWDAIELVYRYTDKPLNAIAKKYNVAGNTIKDRALRYGWIRDNGDARRAIVASQTAVAIPEDLHPLVINTAQEYAADMKRGLAISRNCLRSLELVSEQATDPKEIKVITESTKAAIDTIRSIGGLDAPVSQPSVNIQINSENVAMIMDKLQNEY